MRDFEVKYVAPNGKAHEIKKWLELNLEPDGDFPEAKISSIYFDTKNLDFYNEKLNSDHIKSKFRIRWYTDIDSEKDSDICFFEFKHKVGNTRLKRRHKAANQFSKLKLTSNKFYNCFQTLELSHLPLPSAIFPCFTISYTRKRFIEPSSGLRVCIDSDIHISNNNPLLVRRNQRKTFLSQCVFETKGEIQALPNRCLFFESMGLKKEAFSKYDRCFHELISKEY